MKRLIITDSTCDVPPAMARELEIKILPVTLYLDGKAYQDGVDISLARFYQTFDSYKKMTTGPISYEDYALEFLQIAHQYDEILMIHCSSHLSKFFNVARQVAADFQKKHHARIKVIDSNLCGMGLGLVIIAAAKATRAGKSFDETLKLVNDMIYNTTFYLAIPTLKYLRKNKKIDGLRALIGSAIGVKPIIGLNEGKLDVVNKLFGEQKNMILSMLDIIKEQIAGRSISLAIAYAKDDSLVPNLQAVFEQTFTCQEVYVLQFGPSIGISTGPESLGVAYYIHNN